MGIRSKPANSAAATAKWYPNVPPAPNARRHSAAAPCTLATSARARWRHIIPNPTPISPFCRDAGAGRDAYEKGDLNRAMAEWQAAAERNDPEAEFGLGSLYELGLGNLKQNYKQADYWYRQAADHGNVEAQYRLSLIWATGSED